MVSSNVMISIIICEIITILYDICTIKYNIIPIERYYIHTHNKKNASIIELHMRV